jgi:hypothetical protein
MPNDQEPERKVGGLPADFRMPTVERWKSRSWNPDDRRIFTPKSFGWGYGINFYWLLHPGQRRKR